LQDGDKASDSKSSASSATTSTVASSKVTATSTGKPATAAAKALPSTTQTESRESVRSRLMKLEPKELMKEIVSGNVPLGLLNQVAGRLPAQMLQEAVDFLSKTSSDDDGGDGGADSESLAQQPGETDCISCYLS